jgi:hypothetical protein
MVIQGGVGSTGGGLGAGSGALDTVETGPAQSVLSLETEEVAHAMMLLELSVYVYGYGLGRVV